MTYKYTQKPSYDTMVFQKIYNDEGKALDDNEILYLLNSMSAEIVQLKAQIRKLEEDK